MAKLNSAVMATLWYVRKLALRFSVCPFVAGQLKRARTGLG